MLRRFALSAFVILPFGFAGTAAVAAPSCAIAQFIDKNGAVVPTGTTVVGAVVGDRLLIDGKLPAGLAVQQGERVMTCPYKLVADIKSTYKKACATDAVRDQTAREFRTDRAGVDAECVAFEKFFASP